MQFYKNTNKLQDLEKTMHEKPKFNIYFTIFNYVPIGKLKQHSIYSNAQVREGENERSKLRSRIISLEIH